MTSSHGLTPEQIHEFVVRTRTAQGLPPKITDPVILRKIADLLFAVERSTTEARAVLDDQRRP